MSLGYYGSSHHALEDLAALYDHYRLNAAGIAAVVATSSR